MIVLSATSSGCRQWRRTLLCVSPCILRRRPHCGSPSTRSPALNRPCSGNQWPSNGECGVSITDHFHCATACSAVLSVIKVSADCTKLLHGTAELLYANCTVHPMQAEHNSTARTARQICSKILAHFPRDRRLYYFHQNEACCSKGVCT